MSTQTFRMPIHPPMLIALRAFFCAVLFCIGFWATPDSHTPAWFLALVAAWGGLGVLWTGWIWRRSWIEIDDASITWVRPRLFDPFAEPQTLPRSMLRRVLVLRHWGRSASAVLALELADGRQERLSAMEPRLFYTEVEVTAEQLAAQLGLPYGEGMY